MSGARAFGAIAKLLRLVGRSSRGVALLRELERLRVRGMGAWQLGHLFLAEHRRILPETRPSGAYLHSQPVSWLDVDRLGWMLGMGRQRKYKTGQDG